MKISLSAFRLYEEAPISYPHALGAWSDRLTTHGAMRCYPIVELPYSKTFGWNLAVYVVNGETPYRVNPQIIQGVSNPPQRFPTNCRGGAGEV